MKRRDVKVFLPTFRKDEDLVWQQECRESRILHFRECTVGTIIEG